MIPACAACAGDGLVLALRPAQGSAVGPLDVEVQPEVCRTCRGTGAPLEVLMLGDLDLRPSALGAGDDDVHPRRLGRLWGLLYRRTGGVMGHGGTARLVRR